MKDTILKGLARTGRRKRVDCQAWDYQARARSFAIKTTCLRRRRFWNGSFESTAVVGSELDYELLLAMGDVMLSLRSQTDQKAINGVC
jgi:hypothetical protein